MNIFQVITDAAGTVFVVRMARE